LTLPIALDAMGGDFAPKEVVAGARRAVDELGLEVILVGVPELLGDPRGLEVFACSEVIAMDDDPAASVRKKKDSSLVRACAWAACPASCDPASRRRYPTRDARRW
jgi:glycerol-3-phosphate acyltransferase PlsX